MLFYRLSLLLYRLAIGVASLYNDKARKWVEGRRGWKQKLNLPSGEKRIWVHCSSLGEFEQGRPLIEMLREKYPAYKLVLTFFSPSGYEACKTYTNADYIFYLPLDTPSNARHFLSAISPSLVIFIKYEFWYYTLKEVSKRNIPLLLVCAAFRPSQPFFDWYGSHFRNILKCFTHIHVQDDLSAQLLKNIGICNTSITGDTRYDRVSSIAQRSQPIPEIEHFKTDKKILIAGSTWPADEAILKECLPSIPTNWKLIIAPHEIDVPHIKQLQELFGTDVALFSQLFTNSDFYSRRILVIDNMGMLSRLYAYGNIAFVGGGFAKSGIHNTLEPAIFGLPIIMGPEYKKFVEAVKLVKLGGAFPVSNIVEAISILQSLIENEPLRQEIHNKLSSFMRQNTGASVRICNHIESSGWLS